MKSMWAGIVLIGVVCAGYAETVLINDDFSAGTVGTSLTMGAANDGQWYAENGSLWSISNGVLSNAGGAPNISNNEGALAQLIDLSGITDTNLSSLTLRFSYQGNSATEELYVHLWGMNFDTPPADTTVVVNHGATAGNMWNNGASTTAKNNGDLYNLGNLNGAFLVANVGAYQEAAARITATGTNLVHFSQTFDLSVNINGRDNIAAFDYLVIGITRDATGTDPAMVIDDLTLAVSDPSDNPRPAQPNFVLLLADDLGWQDVKCYDTEAPYSVFETPYMDAMSTEGVKFTQAYSPACLCAPSRAAILTGHHPARLNFTTVSGGAICPQPSALNSRMMVPYFNRRLELEETTLPEILGSNGYINGHIGKWHLEGPDPTQHGFDYSDGNRGETTGMADRLTGFATTNAADLYQLQDFSGQPSTNGFAYDQTTENALRFLGEAVATNKPFFCYYASYLVHAPWHMRTERLLKKYAERMGYAYPLTGNEFFAPGQNNPYYAAMVETFDYNVHRIMTYLEQTDDPRWPGHKLIENTYVFLTSDNGGMENGDANGKVTDNYPLDQGKIYQEEGGTRVPFFAIGPGIATNLESDVMINGLDFMPTMLSLAGIPVPAGLDGCDISTLLLSNPQNEQLVTNAVGAVRDTMVWHYPHASSTRMNSTIRKGGWKLFLNYDHVNNPSANSNRLYELYDAGGARVDIEEMNDLWDVQTNVTSQLDTELRAWLAEVGANIPSYNPNYTGTPLPNQALVPAAITNGNSEGVVWVDYETNKAAMARVDLLYTLNGDSTGQEWFRVPATITAPGHAEVIVPEGTTHYLFNLIDENNFLVSYPDVGTTGDGILDSAFAFPYLEAPYVNPGPQDEIFSEDFSGGSLDTAGLLRDSTGFCIGSSSAWMIDGGKLVNTSLVNSTVSEGAAGCIIDLSSLADPAVDQFTLSFDYTLAEANETLYVHVWGYQDQSSTPTTSIMNHGASNGNAWENAEPAMTAYNFGNSNGVWVGPEGTASDAAVAVSGFQGMTSYARTFDLSEFTSAPNQLGEYDYLVIGFARNFSGSAPAATVDNVNVTVPDLGATPAVFTPDAGVSSWSNLDQWNDDRYGSYQDATRFPSTNDTVVLGDGQILTVDTNATVESISIPNVADASASLVLTNSAAGHVLTVSRMDLGSSTLSGALGAIDQSDGSMDVDSLNVYDDASYRLIGGALNASNLTVSGTFVQSGGSAGATLEVESGGTVNLEGGIFTSPVGADIAVDGVLHVDGGTLSQDLDGVTGSVSLTGSGSFIMDSGAMDFPNGINTSVMYFYSDLEIKGGSFNSSAQTRLNNTLKVEGDRATVQFARLTAQSGSTIVFELGTSGVTPIHAVNWMGLAGGSLQVDAGSYTYSGGTVSIPLFTTANLTDLLDPANVTFTGFLEQGLTASISQSQALDDVNLIIEPYTVIPDVTYSGTADWSSMTVSSSDSVLIDSGAVVTIDGAAEANEILIAGVLRFKLGMTGIEPLTLSSVLTLGLDGAIVVDGTDYEALDCFMPLIYCSELFDSLTNRVSFVGFEGREPAVVILDEGMWLRLVEPPTLSERICSLAPASTANADYTDSIFSATRGFKPTGSVWGSLYDESVAMNTTLEQTVTDGGSGELNQSWAMTIGHGGQIASFRVPSLGETVPPQWQSNPGSAPWIDEVWQSVAIDQTLNSAYDNAPYFIHQAGVYPTKDDELTEAFYSPSVAAYVNEEERRFMMINWGQHAHLQVYTNSITENDWRSDMLYFTGVKDLGDGVIEVSQGYYNYGEDTPNYFNMPWGGVRRTSTEYAFFSDPSGAGWTDALTAMFGDGASYKYYDTDGAMAFSASTNGSTPCLGFVFGQDPDPLLPYQTMDSQMRYGYAGGNPTGNEDDWRNYYVISAIRRYTLSQGRGVWSRYYFVLADDLDDLERRIEARDLLLEPSLEPFDYTEENTPLVAYSYTGSGADFRIVENSTSPQFFLYAYPLSDSFPIYEILEDDETYHITWDPYATGVVKTYDGTIAGIRLLGFAPRTADVSGSSYTYESLDTLMASASENYMPSGEMLSARTATSFETWKVQYFGMTDDSGDGAGAANPDNDGANNLTEYAMGGNPLDPADTGYVPSAGVQAEDGTNWFEFVHPRRIGSEGEIAYQIESTSNLISNDWKNAAHTEIPMTGSLDATYEAVTNRIDTTGETNKFFRLKVEEL